MIRSTSPAKTLPKRRNENEIAFANSPRSSKMPTKKLIGLLKEIKCETCLPIPLASTAYTLVAMTEIAAKAMVKFKSLATDLKKGIKIVCPASIR